MLYLYQATANLKNSEPSYLVFKKRPENKVLLKHTIFILKKLNLKEMLHL